jgi:hypothetical protein
MDAGELPEELRGLDDGKKREVIAARAGERRRIREDLRGLSDRRDAYLREEAGRSGGPSPFDREIGSMLRLQAAKKGFRFEESPSR